MNLFLKGLLNLAVKVFLHIKQLFSVFITGKFLLCSQSSCVFAAWNEDETDRGKMIE